MYIFSEASQRSGILNPWIWLANDARSSGPDFPIRTPRTDCFNPRENLKWNHFTPAQRNAGFFFLKRNVSLINHCKLKGKISNGIKGLVILQKKASIPLFLLRKFCWLASSCSFLMDTPFDLTRLNYKVVFWPSFLGWNFVLFLGDLFSNLVPFSFIQDNMIINDCYLK